MLSETRIEIDQDGVVLHGGEWITPQDLTDQDIEAGRLPCLKGTTPIDWPELEPTERHDHAE